MSVNEVLRLARPRDHTKVRLRSFSVTLSDSGPQQIFKFADSDLKASAKALKHHEDDLNRALKSALPGLLSEFSPTSTTPSSQLIVTDDRYGGGRNGAGGSHKALVSADPFNVSILFGPTLAFMERVKEVMPSGGMPGAVVLEDEGNGVGAFLDGFVLKTFLPQLEEKVTSVFHQAVGGEFEPGGSEGETDDACRSRRVPGGSELQEGLSCSHRQGESSCTDEER